MKTDATAPADDILDLGDASLDALDEAEMTVVINGKVTTWVWIFAGPGHEKTVAWGDKIAKQRLHEERQREQAQVNGRKWKAPEETPDEVRERNVQWVLARLLRWSPVRMNGEDFPFTPENARTVLIDPRKDIYRQAIEFLADEQSFTPRSATS